MNNYYFVLLGKNKWLCIMQSSYICSEKRTEENFKICDISSLWKLWICGLQPHVRERPLEIHGNSFTYSVTFTDGVFGSFPKTLAMEIFEELMPCYLLAVWFGMGFSAGSSMGLVPPWNAVIHVRPGCLKTVCLYWRMLEEDQSCN